MPKHMIIKHKMRKMRSYKFAMLSVFSLLFVLTSCLDEDQEFGDIIVPSNLSLSFEIVGQDAENPGGDGSGFVNFTGSADNAITYRYEFGDNSDVQVAPNGDTTHRFTITGTNTYTVTLIASGTGGVSSSTSITLDVYSVFDDQEAKDFLAGQIIGESKTWYWASNLPLHVGLGPFEDDYGSGEFAYEAWWNSIQPFDEEKSCMYADRFVFTKTAESEITFEQTEGPGYVPGAYAGVVGLDSEVCYDATVLTSIPGVKNVSFVPSSSKAALQGSYNGEPYRGSSFAISDEGFMGWYVGSSTYDIISIDEDYMRVRVIQAGSPYGDGGYAWYHLFTSSDPTASNDLESIYNDLVWEDDFNTDGAPNPANWTYDIGTGEDGWGNFEEQYYTDDANNVIVEGGNLKITARAEAFMGSNYTSSRLKSKDLFEFTYGRVDISAKLPEGAGTWAALWMLGANIDEVSWPAAGEIDIAEHIGIQQNTITAALHFPGNSGEDNIGGQTSVPTASSEFHTYTVEWRPDEILFAVDNQIFFSTENTGDLPFNDDFFLLLNIAMGGINGGDIDPGFTESTMEIDYVRVYQND